MVNLVTSNLVSEEWKNKICDSSLDQIDLPYKKILGVSKDEPGEDYKPRKYQMGEDLNEYSLFDNGDGKNSGVYICLVDKTIILIKEHWEYWGLKNKE